MVELTDRQKITELISVKPMDAQSLSRAIEFQLLCGDHFIIFKICWKSIKITPSQCRDCDYF